MFPEPDRPRMVACKRCGHRTRADRLVHGYGRDCAVRLGLIGDTIDVGQSGPDLFDVLDETADMCDGWDRDIRVTAR